MDYVYVAESNGYHKIGKTKDVQQRLSSLQTGNPHTVRIVKTYKVKDAFHMESYLHKVLSNTRVGGEWFSASLEEIEYQAGQYFESLEYQVLYTVLNDKESIEVKTLIFNQQIEEILEKDLSLPKKKCLLMRANLWPHAVTQRKLFDSYGIDIDRFKRIKAKEV